MLLLVHNVWWSLHSIPLTVYLTRSIIKLSHLLPEIHDQVWCHRPLPMEHTPAPYALAPRPHKMTYTASHHAHLLEHSRPLTCWTIIRWVPKIDEEIKLNWRKMDTIWTYNESSNHYSSSSTCFALPTQLEYDIRDVPWLGIVSISVGLGSSIGWESHIRW